MGGFDFTGGKIMAERRMFAKTIVDSDAFIDMPTSARLLYYDLGMRADDDGFVNSPKKIMKFSGASDDDLRILSAKKFIIPFESGVVVIKHWKIHNYIRKDTYTETKYKGEKAMLYTDENNAYSTTNPLLNSGEETPSTIRGRAVDEPLTQVRLGKVRLGKDSIDSADKPLDEFEAAIEFFKDHRKKLKKPMTDHAVELLKSKLETLAPNDKKQQIALINHAIEKGWQGVYPIDNFKKGDRVEPTEKDYTTSTSAYEIL
jgi:hypothetical protein